MMPLGRRAAWSQPLPNFAGQLAVLSPSLDRAALQRLAPAGAARRPPPAPSSFSSVKWPVGRLLDRLRPGHWSDLNSRWTESGKSDHRSARHHTSWCPINATAALTTPNPVRHTPYRPWTTLYGGHTTVLLKSRGTMPCRFLIRYSVFSRGN